MRREKLITIGFYLGWALSLIVFVWMEWGGFYAFISLFLGTLLGILPIFSATMLTILVISAWFEGKVFHNIHELSHFVFIAIGIAILFGSLFGVARIWFYRASNRDLSTMNRPLRLFLRFANISTKPGMFFLTGQHNTDRITQNGNYVVEMNDQGICFDPTAIKLTVNEIEDSLRIKDCDVITFVHGWNHNASSKDSNLIEFEKILGEISNLRNGKKVIGIYVGWQGKKYRGLPQKTTTFYDRSRRTQTIAQGSLIELYQRLSELRSRASSKRESDLFDMKLVHWGHSFGGAIVYTAFSQEILKSCLERNAPRSADKILLLNPAISGSAFLGTYTALSKSQLHNNNITHNSLPDGTAEQEELVRIAHDKFLVCLTSEGDVNLSKDFKSAFKIRTLTEAYYQPIERICLFTPMGLVDAFQTHNINSNQNSIYNPSSIHIQITSAEFIKDHNDIWNIRIAEMIANQLL